MFSPKHQNSFYLRATLRKKGSSALELILESTKSYRSETPE